MAKIARLPDAWKINGKADIDGVLAAGHGGREVAQVFAAAATPDAFAASLPKEEQEALQSKLEKSFHPAVLKHAVQTLSDKKQAPKLALRIGRADDVTNGAALFEKAMDKGWPLGPIKAALKEGERQRRERENERRMDAGELCLLYDQTNGHAWFLDNDQLVEMKLDSEGRGYLVGLAGDPAESAVRTALNVYLQKAQSEGTRVTSSALVTKVAGAQRIYIGSEPGRLVRLSPGTVELSPNGANPDHVFIRPAPHWAPWQYRPDVDLAATARFLLDGAAGAWAVSPADRLLLLGLALSVFVLPLLPGLGLVILAGMYGMGKSLVASTLSWLLDGIHVEPVALKEDVIVARAAESWLLSIDEAEPVTVEKLARVLNMLAKGGVGSDRPASALPVLCAANLKLMPGTAQRAFILPVSKDHQQAVQVNDALYNEAIKARRNEILSMVVHVLATKVLPAVFDGTLDKIVAELNAKASDHPNQRNFHALAAAWLIVEALHEVAGLKAPDRLLSTWLRDQASRHLDLAAGTSELVAALETLRVRAESMSTERFQTEFHLCFDKPARSLQCSSRELLTALRVANNSLSVRTSAELTTALKANQDVLMHRGWIVQVCAKTVRGDNVHVLKFPGDDQDGVGPQARSPISPP